MATIKSLYSLSTRGHPLEEQKGQNCQHLKTSSLSLKPQSPHRPKGHRVFKNSLLMDSPFSSPLNHRLTLGKLLDLIFFSLVKQEFCPALLTSQSWGRLSERPESAALWCLGEPAQLSSSFKACSLRRTEDVDR